MQAPEWLDTAAYPFRNRWVDVGEGRMHYVDEGEGPTLLFVHGTPTWSFEYRHVISALKSRYRCVAPDHLGFGLSDRPEAFDYTPESHARMLQAFVEKLGLRDFVLVVHDFGGPIGLPLALAGKASAVVVLNSWMWSFDDDAQMKKRAKFASGAVGKFLYRRLNASLKLITPSAYADKKKLTKEIHAQYLNVFPDADSRERVLWALARAFNGSSRYYASLEARAGALTKLPVQIIWGVKDSAFQPYQLARWKKLLPNANVVELPNSGHWPHEEEPDAVIAAMSRFLSELPLRVPTGGSHLPLPEQSLR